MLKDNSKDIRLEAEACLGEFLREIKEVVNAKSSVDSVTPSNKKKKNVDFGSLVKILLVHSTSRGEIPSYTSRLLTNLVDEFTRLAAINWINEFIIIGKEELLTFSAQLLSAILPCLSHDVQGI